MPLTGKYLKYSPEITLEIFTLVWNELIECGYDVSPGRNTIFNNFKGKWPHLLLDKRSICTRGIKPDLLETTVQEILGYNPFKDDFVLPEKWCIRNSKDKQLLEFFENYNHGGYNGNSQKILHYPRISGNCLYPSAQKGYTEITFEQFQKYVLKTTEQPKVMEAKVESKTIEKWGVGSYVVFINNYGFSKIGDIDLIIVPLDGGVIKCEKELTISTDPNYVKWFATKSEAEEFAKTLTIAKEEIKQQLKQAVHCKTQEEWDFVYDKRGHKKPNSLRGNSNCVLYIYRDGITSNSSLEWVQMNQSDGYQILAFQEWCDLNGYKMENEVKFEVGNWYYFELKEGSERIIKCISITDKAVYCDYWGMNGKLVSLGKNLWSLNNIENIKELSIEEIQQYLPDGHPDKFTPVIQQTRDMQSEFKVGEYVFWKNGNKVVLLKDVTCKIANKRIEEFRHATPEEINNHLISIGQIPAGEPLNTGIEPNKDGMFKYTTVGGNSFSGKCSTSMTRTVEIIKPATIEFNYLPEPE